MDTRFRLPDDKRRKLGWLSPRDCQATLFLRAKAPVFVSHATPGRTPRPALAATASQEPLFSFSSSSLTRARSSLFSRSSLVCSPPVSWRRRRCRGKRLPVKYQRALFALHIVNCTAPSSKSPAPTSVRTGRCTPRTVTFGGRSANTSRAVRGFPILSFGFPDFLYFSFIFL